jgi:hypothetical protein
MPLPKAAPLSTATSLLRNKDPKLPDTALVTVAELKRAAGASAGSRLALERVLQLIALERLRQANEQRADS